MFSSKLLLIVAIAIAAYNSAVTVSSLNLQAGAQNDKLVNGHMPGKSYRTIGDVHDPELTDGKIDGIDPEKYLRSFNYDRVSTLENGTTLREFTIIADDRQTLEVSPGVSVFTT